MCTPQQLAEDCCLIPLPQSLHHHPCLIHLDVQKVTIWSGHALSDASASQRLPDAQSQCCFHIYKFRVQVLWEEDKSKQWILPDMLSILVRGRCTCTTAAMGNQWHAKIVRFFLDQHFHGHRLFGHFRWSSCYTVAVVNTSLKQLAQTSSLNM